MENPDIQSYQDYLKEDSLKYYRDLKASLTTSYEEGKKDGREEGREEGMEIVALKIIRQNEPTKKL